MACFHPLKAYRSTERNPETGKYGLTFSATKALVEGSFIALPCGRCEGCRLQKARQWALRCYHEGRMHGRNSFLTLTYDDQHVPTSYGLDLIHWQRFMYRYRRHQAYRGGDKIRFFACGEYGERGLRPHYHALIFGHDFEDKAFIRTTPRGDRVFASKTLAELWPFGSHEIGELTYKSCGYVARYSMKKVNGDRAADHYRRVSPIDGNIYNVRPEFAVMSRRPGIGTNWFHKFKGDAFPSDFLIIDGSRVKPPNFYLAKLDDEEQRVIKRERKRYAAQPRQKYESSKARLAVREEVQRLRAQRLLRKLES